jgi:ribonucleoside-triphosphate reductase (thioredoxin)
MKYIDNPYEQFIHTSRYARWRDDLGRRESWGETVDRYVDYMVNSLATNNDYTPPQSTVDEIRLAILNRQVLPSMRSLMTAGPALDRENVAGYNCAFIAIDHPRAFDEALYILMNGTGVGFSAESQYVNQLPVIPETITNVGTFKVGDSKLGWAQALQRIIEGLYRGELNDWDLSDIRPAGSRLRTFGGRASGPEPLNELFNFVVAIFATARGRKLSPLEAHEIFCKIGEVVVVGGVRRSALISLSDLGDVDIRDAKHGEFWSDKPHLSLSNNSAVYDERPSRAEFDAEFDALIASKSGERGIFSRYGARRKVTEIGRSQDEITGTNPCGEILLRSAQFCNLTTVIVDPTDDEASLRQKVRLATVLGTWQSTLTNFNHLRDIWRENTEEERLLGVSLNGIFGNERTSGKRGDLPALLDYLRNEARYINALEADAIGIPHSAAITTVKPEGTTSQLCNVSSGAHPWHAPYYVRNVRGDTKDPLSRFLIDAGVPSSPDTYSAGSVVFSFPIAAPKGAVTRDDLTAIEHLEMWAVYSKHWTDHNPSITVNVRDNEWDDVREWVWEHFDAITGIAFLPFDDSVYTQAPYEPIDAMDYEFRVLTMPDINWEDFQSYELEDSTKGSQTMACMSGGCNVDYF